MDHTPRIFFIITGLAIIALMIVVWILSPSRSLSPANQNAPKTSFSPSSDSDEVPQIPSITPQPIRTLTPDERQAIQVPLHNATAEEKRRHTEIVDKIVQKTGPLIIQSSCIPNPTALEVSLNGTFIVKNEDSVPHILRYQTKQIMLPARSTTTVQTANWFSAPGDYGYGCDNPFAKAGVLVVR